MIRLGLNIVNKPKLSCVHIKPKVKKHTKEVLCEVGVLNACISFDIFVISYVNCGTAETLEMD